MASLTQPSQDSVSSWDLDFSDVQLIVVLFGTEDDARLFETLYSVYEDQWRDPECLPDSAIGREAARRLGITPNTFYQQLRRMRKRAQQNTKRFLLAG